MSQQEAAEPPIGVSDLFVLETHRLYARALAGEKPAPMRVFHASIGSLSLLFLGVALDALLVR